MNGNIDVISGNLRQKQSMSGKLSSPVQRSTPGDYNPLRNHPHIEGNELIGDKTFIELGLFPISNQEIDDIFDEYIYGG